MRYAFAGISSWVSIGLLLSGCGYTDAPEQTPGLKSGDGAAQHDSDSAAPARISLSGVRTSVTSSDTIAVIEYQNTDFMQAVRCVADFSLRLPSGLPARGRTGQMVEMSELEATAVWQTALSDTIHCRLISEKLLRISFSDPFAASGKYFYIFNPCRLPESVLGHKSNNGCSYSLVSTDIISITNTLTEEKKRLHLVLLTKEAELAAITLKFRHRLMVALEAQQSCEESAVVDAVREAKTKVLASVLATGIAAAVGGAVAGPGGAVTLAQQTLQWITQYFGPGTESNSTRCRIYKDAESEAQAAGSEIDRLRNEIGQIHEELAARDSSRIAR